MGRLLLLVFLMPTLAHADGDSDPVRLAELMEEMVASGLAQPVGTNDAAAMGLLPSSLLPVTLGERHLLEASFLALRAEPRSDGGMVSRTTWVVDCAERSLAIRSLTSHADAATADVIATQAWTDTEAPPVSPSLVPTASGARWWTRRARVTRQRCSFRLVDSPEPRATPARHHL